MKANATLPASAEKSELYRLIAEHPFCHGLSEAHLQRLVESAMRRDFEKGETVFTESDLANRFYLVREGKVLLESHETGEETMLVDEIGAGDVLGWSWLFPPYRLHFDARTAEPTRAIFFYGTRLREQCDRDPGLGYELMKRISRVVIDRLQVTRQKLLALHRHK